MFSPRCRVGGRGRARGRALDRRHRRGGARDPPGHQGCDAAGCRQRRCADRRIRRMQRRHHRDHRRRRVDRRAGDRPVRQRARGRRRLRQGIAVRERWQQRRHHRGPPLREQDAQRPGQPHVRHAVHRPVLRLQRVLGAASGRPGDRLPGFRGGDPDEHPRGQGRAADPGDPQLRTLRACTGRATSGRSGTAGGSSR